MTIKLYQEALPSALALMKTIDVSYPTAWLMLQKIRAAMSERDQMYQLSGLIQLDEMREWPNCHLCGSNFIVICFHVVIASRRLQFSLDEDTIKARH